MVKRDSVNGKPLCEGINVPVKKTYALWSNAVSKTLINFICKCFLICYKDAIFNYLHNAVNIAWN